MCYSSPATLARCSRVLQVPLLALFGSLQPEDYVHRNATALEAAKQRAMHNLQRCVIANTDDMASSGELVSYVRSPRSRSFRPPAFLLQLLLHALPCRINDISGIWSACEHSLCLSRSYVCTARRFSSPASLATAAACLCG